jgi:hypothetical protein
VLLVCFEYDLFRIGLSTCGFVSTALSEDESSLPREKARRYPYLALRVILDWVRPYKRPPLIRIPQVADAVVDY